MPPKKSDLSPWRRPRGQFAACSVNGPRDALSYGDLYLSAGGFSGQPASVFRSYMESLVPLSKGEVPVTITVGIEDPLEFYFGVAHGSARYGGARVSAVQLDSGVHHELVSWAAGGRPVGPGHIVTSRWGCRPMGPGHIVASGWGCWSIDVTDPDLQDVDYTAGEFTRNCEGAIISVRLDAHTPAEYLQ